MTGATVSDHTKVSNPAKPRNALKDPRTRYAATIRLLRAYLCDDTDETQYHIWWIQHRYGLTDAQLIALLGEACKAAEGHRHAGMADEICARIDHQLAELEQ
jgi:hypothetical protein